MAEDLVVSRSWVVPAAELHERFSRSSGPGGQSVNTTDSRVELVYAVASSRAVPEHLRARVLERLADRLVRGSLTVTAAEFRSQHANRQAARERMVTILRDAAAPPPRRRRATRPTRGSQERRIAAKKRRGETKRLRRGYDD